MRKWTEQSAVATLNHDGFEISRKIIMKPKGHASTGLKKCSAIDFLVKYCGYKF